MARTKVALYVEGRLKCYIPHSEADAMVERGEAEARYKQCRDGSVKQIGLNSLGPSMSAADDSVSSLDAKQMQENVGIAGKRFEPPDKARIEFVRDKVREFGQVPSWGDRVARTSLLTKQQKERVEAYRRAHPAHTTSQIAKKLGLTKEYVDAYLHFDLTKPLVEFVL